MNEMVKAMAFYLCKNNVIETDNMDIYVYGLDVLISGVVGALVILFAGILFNRVRLSVIYLATMIPIRMYTGGYHADTHMKCNISFLMVYMISVAMLNITIAYNFQNQVNVLAVLMLFVIYKYSPLENSNKYIDDTEKKKYHKIGCGLYAGYLIIAVTARIMNYLNGNYINIVLIQIAVLLVVGKWKGRYTMKKAILKMLADCALFTAKRAGNSASFYGLYQPKEPKIIAELGKRK